MFNFLKNKIFSSALIAIPALFLLVNVMHYKVSVPYDDDWNFIPTVAKFYNHSLSFTDLWTPINEHRPVLYKMIRLNIIRFTSWDVTYELLFTILLAILIFFFVFSETRKIFQKVHIASIWPYVAISIMIFSLNQFESWLLGGQFSVFLCLLAFLAGMKFLARGNLLFSHFTLAVLAGIISTFSFGYGVLFWPLGLLFLVGKRKRVNKKYLFVWTVISVCILALYFYGLTISSSPHINQPIVGYIISFTAYIFLFLGRPLGIVLYHRLFLSIIFGILGLGFNISSFLIIYRYKIINFRKIIYPLLLSLTTLGCTVMAAFARSGYGYEQAHSSRYITMGNFLWISNIILFAIISRKTNLFKPNGAKIISIFFFLFIIASSLRSLKEMRIFSDMFKAGRYAVLTNAPILPKLVHPEHRTYKESVAFLKKYKLSLFRE